jgi:hypothetical protein
MFNTFGKTWQRSFLTQQQSVASWGASVVQVPFQQIANVGLLRKLQLFMPYTTGTVALGGGTNAIQGGLQAPQLRVLNEFSLNLQSAIQIYNLWNGSGGLELGMLKYIADGDFRKDYRLPMYGTSYNGAPSGSKFPFAFPDLQASNPGDITNIGPWANYNTNLLFSYAMDIPISTYIAFPNTPIAKSGNAVIVSDDVLEIGLLVMQSNLQNLTPIVKLNPLYALTSSETPTISTGAATCIAASAAFNMQVEAYDIPASTDDWPQGLEAKYVVTRSSKEVAISGAATTTKFIPGGLLTDVIYLLLNDTTNRGALVDATATASTRIQLKSGATEMILDEFEQMNAYNATLQYRAAPPGCIVHGRCHDGTIVDALDTVALTELRTDFTALPAAATRMRWIEKRLIPVR